MSLVVSVAASLCLLASPDAAIGDVRAHADSVWDAGLYSEAAGFYRAVLRADPRSARANYRIGLWLSWEGRLDSARVMIRRARAIEPDDHDLQVAEAQILSWAGRLSEAIALDDSVLLADPSRADARLGRAQALAWAGRYGAADSTYDEALRRRPDGVEALDGRAQLAVWWGRPARAEALYARVLEAHPENVDALVGLARLHHQQGRERSAGRQLERALAIAPASRAAQQLAQDVRASRRPRIEVAARLGQDSDRNVVWSRLASTEWSVADGVRGFASGSSVLASDPSRDATGAGGELGASFSQGPYQWTAAAGARRLSPRGGLERSAASGRGILSARLAPGAVIGAGYSRAPFDENAMLIGSRIDVEAWDASVELALPAKVTLSGGTGGAWLSDGNRRRSAAIAFSRPVDPHVTVTIAARSLGYDHPGAGYFSPDRFTMAEARFVAGVSRGPWSGSTRAGLGAQQVGRRSAGQLDWHAEEVLRFGWSAASQIELSVGGSNSATSSTTGAYSSFSSALTLRLGL